MSLSRPYSNMLTHGHFYNDDFVKNIVGGGHSFVNQRDVLIHGGHCH
jgi:hypothetical protein